MKDQDPRISFFDQCAEHWDHHGPPPEEMIARLEQLLPMLNLGRGEDLLEVGCGTGSMTAWLAKTVTPGRVVAMDFSPAMLAKARSRGTNADFVELDICSTRASDRLGERKFTTVLCLNVFPHFRDPVMALQNIRRSMQPDGKLIVLHLVGREHLHAIHANAGEAVRHDRLLQEEEWSSLLDQTGFQRVQLTDQPNFFLLIAKHNRSAT